MLCGSDPRVLEYSREGGRPGIRMQIKKRWIPAFAGMTVLTYAVRFFSSFEDCADYVPIIESIESSVVSVVTRLIIAGHTDAASAAKIISASAGARYQPPAAISACS